jgi:hypothetical protein
LHTDTYVQYLLYTMQLSLLLFTYNANFFSGYGIDGADAKRSILVPCPQ